MRAHPINSTHSKGTILQNLNKKPRATLAFVGLLTTIFSLPLLSSKATSADKDQIASRPSSSKEISDKDRETINFLRSFRQGIDLRNQETEWVQMIWPTVRSRLITMYQAEREDNLKLVKREIEDEGRRVKICYTDFVPKDKRGDDGGSELNLHVVKYFDEKQEDSRVLRTYVNEHWPINETTGGILPTEAFRIRVQVFKGELNQEGAEKLFITDMLQCLWGDNFDGSKGNTNMYPFFYRQHLYGTYDKETKTNTKQQLQTPVSSPLKCISCHNSRATFTQDIFLKPFEKRENFGAITPDKEFLKPYHEQKGYTKYKSYLEERVKKGEIKEDYAKAILKDLMNSTNMENPAIVEALKEHTKVGWLEGDTKQEKGGYYNANGFTYTDEKGETWTKAAFDRYKDELFINTWWYKKDLQIIPRSR